MKLIIYTDGGARCNPGPGASAYVIQNTEGKTLNEDGMYLGQVTNNQAEYSAVKLALTRALTLFPQESLEIEIRADSLLIVKQLQGEYKVKDGNLQIFYKDIKSLEKNIRQIKYQYIPRDKNQLADKLVNQTLDLQK